MSVKPTDPKLVVSNRQRAVSLNLSRLEELGVRALEPCLKQPGPGAVNLARLSEVEVTLVSDRVIARVHRQFMGIPGATDVITFAHGELVVSATTAWREAQALGEPVEREVLRYIVHGLLHLGGYEDSETADAALMWRVQETILDQIWPWNPQTL